MNTGLTIETERVDDIPVLVAEMNRMGIAELVDEHFTMHGNWQGIQLGRVMTGWLAHVLSEADHRLNHVQSWAEKRPKTLQGCLGADVNSADFTDDRLAVVLDKLSEDGNWSDFEAALNRRTLRVYNLERKCVRLDSTTANGYWEVTDDGLFQFGHSKDHRPDQPQVKVMLSTLDPLGMPVAVQVVSGEKADDPLYIPAIEQVRRGLNQAGLLYVGDCKIMSLETRAYLQAGDDYYLGPFSKVQIPNDSLESYLQPVWAGKQELIPVYRVDENGERIQVAEGYERAENLTTTVAGKAVTWVERRLVVHSLAQAHAAEIALYARLDKAQAALKKLNERRQGKERLIEIEMLRKAAEALLKQQDVEGLLTLAYIEQVEERPVRQYKDRPAETRIERTVILDIQRDTTAIQAAIDHLGWRVYGTNQPAEQLPLEQAVLAYREEYRVERNFGRLKGKPLSLTPMYLQDDNRATGLIRLLSIGLRVLSLLEGVVRQKLAENHSKLAGLYMGNPKRATAFPTAEALLQAFKDVFLNVAHLGDQVNRYISPLSELQIRILTLLGLPQDIYLALVAESS
jgi:transposase